MGLTEQQQESRGRAAKALLEDPLYVEAFDAVRARLLIAMEGAATDEASLRAKMLLGLLNDVRGYLARVVQDGVLSAETIVLEERRKKWNWR